MESTPSSNPCQHQDQFLDLLNSKLRSFIQDCVEHDRPVSGPSDLFLARELETQCWELMDCKTPECPAHSSRDRRCWLHAGTLCGGQVQGGVASKIGSCYSCEVLQRVSSDPAGGVYENILILIHHLQQRAERIRGMAIADALTGLYNRRYLDEVAAREQARIARNGSSIGVLVIDLDGLKRVNDEFGHHAGDEIIRAAAEVLKGSFRGSDLVFRTGGDEFLVLLSDPVPEAQNSWSLRLDQATKAWNERHAAERGHRLAMSVGSATCQSGQDLFAVIQRADARMYQAKQARKAARQG